MNATINHDADSARLGIAEQLSIIRTLLRLLDPSSPFQPILVGSVDLVAWQAFVGQAVETIESLLPKAVSPLPRRTRESISAAASPLFSLAHSICDAPRAHMSEHAAELCNQGLLPEFVGLGPDPGRSPEEQNLVDQALAASLEFLKQSAGQVDPLCKALSDSAKRLTDTLNRKHGLMWLLRRGLKKSKRFREKFQHVADELEAVLSTPHSIPEMPWPDASSWFAKLAAVIEVHALPAVDAVLKEAVPTTPRAARSQAQSRPPTRQSIKNSCIRSWDSFLQTYTTACHIAATHHAYPLWRLFAGLTETLSSALLDAGVLEGSVASSSDDERVVAGIARLDHRIIARPVLAKWDQTLIAEDDYALQIVLAGIHHIERPDEDDGNTGSTRRRLVYEFSEETMARWLSRGAYAGVNPDREASGKFETETRRTRRALEHLRRNQAAFHGRRHWSPLPDRITNAASDRRWTINPLLSAHPAARRLIELNPATSAAGSTTRETRPRPSRRNRKLRRKS